MILIKILLVLLAAVVTFSEDEKSFNLKIGFDLIKGENGMPALRVRDFQESAPHVTPDPKQTQKHNIGKDVAEDKKPKKKRKSEKETAVGKQSAVVRAEDSSKSKSQSSSSKSSEEEKPKAREGSSAKSPGTSEPKKEKHKESGKSSNTASKSKENGDEDSEAKALKHITKGVINAEEYEPEEKNPKQHDSKDENDDDTRRSRRFKRQAFTLKKRYRGKKFSSSSKKVTNKYRRSVA